MTTLAGSTAPGLGAQLSPRRRLADRAAAVYVTAAAAVAVIPLAWVLFTVVSKGITALTSSQWWTNSQRGLTIRTEGGGAYHAIVGTLTQAAITAAISVPIGVLCAIYLVEYGRGRMQRAVSFMVDILTGIPSIVAALFIYALWVTTLGFSRVGFAVSLALVLLMVPVVTRATEEMLRVVPTELREGSYALGVAKWRTIVSVVIPTSISGIITGIMLGLARVMGETAPLLILGPYSSSINTNPFSGFQAALPTMINQNRTESLPLAVERTWGAALTLILLVMALNLAARLVSRVGSVRTR